ncbi:MAG: diadenylate cyclase, partial [Candidatus Aenigmatarchaeota archaeon]
MLDIIDIGVISLFIYLILVWLKKAKARFIFLGMIILGSIYIFARLFNLYLTTLSIYIFARLFNLYLTTLIFQAFFAVFLITIIVIFQEELRHFFERIAIWGIPRRSFYKFPIREEIDILCNAIVNLLRKKIGALVVIKGNDPLERHISGGIELDGLLSDFILESIFNPLSPTHDGAVIIEKNRIVKFSGHLPLSTNVKETAPLGTRHAAGLGVSERTDALCIIVSEERGIISVAEGGKLKQINDISELKLILENFYKEKYPSKKKFSFREFVMGHLLEKIIAVILAIGFWTIFGRRVEIVRRDFIIPIEYRNLASEKIIGEPKPKNISITLSGTERDFYLFKQEELKLSLDMSKTKDGENVFLITKDFIK